MVGYVSGAEAIWEMWERHYSSLLNYSSNFSKQQEVLQYLEDISPDDSVDRITPEEIRCAIKSLKKWGYGGIYQQ